MVARATTVALLMRHSANLIVAVVVFTEPASTVAPSGKWLIVVLAGWAIYRVTTRSHSLLLIAVDYVLTIAVCLAVPALVSDPASTPPTADPWP